MSEELKNIQGVSPEEQYEEVPIVTLTNEDGTEEDYEEVDTVEVDGKLFSILVHIPAEDEEEQDHEDGCDCGCDGDDTAIIARIDIIDGEPVYVAPTDEEFEQAAKAYEAMIEEALQDEED